MKIVKKRIPIFIVGLFLFSIMLTLSGCNAQTGKSSDAGQSSNASQSLFASLSSDASQSSDANQPAAEADARSVYTAAATVVATNPGTAYNGYSTGTTKITDAMLATYLGAKSTWKFTVIGITFDASNNLTGVQIKENGKYYKYDGTAVTSSATSSASQSSIASQSAAEADARTVYTAACVAAVNTAYAYNGYSTGTTKITDAILAQYLGAKSTWKFTITDITFDAATGGVTSAQIKENGKYYKCDGTAVTSSATLMTQP